MFSISIGSNAGYLNQGRYAIAIGEKGGYENQGYGSICIGSNSGICNQGNNSIVVGNNSGKNNLGNYSIVFGNNVECTSENTVVFKTGGVDTQTIIDEPGFYLVNCIRGSNLNLGGTLHGGWIIFDQTKKEFIYDSGPPSYVYTLPPYITDDIAIWGLIEVYNNSYIQFSMEFTFAGDTLTIPYTTGALSITNATGVNYLFVYDQIKDFGSLPAVPPTNASYYFTVKCPKIIVNYNQSGEYIIDDPGTNPYITVFNYYQNITPVDLIFYEYEP